MTNPHKELRALKELLSDSNIEDEPMEPNQMNDFERSMRILQIAGEMTLLRTAFGYNNMRSRVKSTKSIMNKFAYFETTDLTTTQDIAAITVVKPDIDGCYQVLCDFLQRGYTPYYKVMDTLNDPINKCRTLDVYLRNERDSFELQIRYPEADRIHTATHDPYKDSTSPLDPNPKIVLEVRRQFEQLAQRTELHDKSIYDILDALTTNPQMGRSWRVFKTSPEIDSILSQYDIQRPSEEVMAENKVFI